MSHNGHEKLPVNAKPGRKTFTDDFKRETIQLIIDGLSASTVTKNQDNGNTNLLYCWKAELITRRPATHPLACDAQHIDPLVVQYYAKECRTVRSKPNRPIRVSAQTIIHDSLRGDLAEGVYPRQNPELLVP